MVALRHTGSSTDQHRTTLILLCEDGSLRIYMANVDNTGYWMSPQLQPQSIISSIRPAKKKKLTKTTRSRCLNLIGCYNSTVSNLKESSNFHVYTFVNHPSPSGHPTGSLTFPIDYFENCLQANDVEVINMPCIFLNIFSRILPFMIFMFRFVITIFLLHSLEAMTYYKCIMWHK